MAAIILHLSSELEFYDKPLPQDSHFGEIVAKSFTPNGIRVEFFRAEKDEGVFLHRNAIFVPYLEGYVRYDKLSE